MRKIFLALVVLSALSSCRLLRPSLMLKTPKNYVFDKVSDTMLTEEYRIAPTDAVSFRILSNEGFKLVDLASNSPNANLAISNIETTVELDGTIKVPLIGRIKVEGLTVREAEQLLETRYTEFYVGPYVLFKVTNKRVIIFPGNAGAARVVPIVNNNTTVFEALAMAGGVSEDGRAYKVKLVRKTAQKPKVYMMDLSTIDGLREGNTIVQANDIIYVEPRNRIGQRLSTEVLPYISLLSSIFIIYSLYARVQ
jgi:polysaccharide biosynthesis/export protein